MRLYTLRAFISIPVIFVRKYRIFFIVQFQIFAKISGLETEIIRKNISLTKLKNTIASLRSK